MAKYVYYQPNKNDTKDKYGDCVVRAITKVFDLSWEDAFMSLIPSALKIKSMPDTKEVLNEYFKEKNIKWVGCKAVKGKPRLTPKTFKEKGSYVLSLAGHILAVENGCYYDTWDSGECCVYGYWVIKE